MLNHLPASPSRISRRLLALAALSVLGFGAGQAGALPAVQLDVASGLLLVEGGTSGSERPAAEDRQASLDALKEVLEATRAQLEELTEASAIVTTINQLREELQALEEKNQRLAAELQQARSRGSELESSSGRAETRIAELTEAMDEARREAGRLDEALTRLRRQNGQLRQEVTRARSAREAALAEAERTQAEITKKLEEATDAAAGSRAELAAVREQLGQAASAAVEAERAREAAKSEASALRSETARAQQELVAARTDIDRLNTAKRELEQQIAALDRESRSATETARQTLTVMIEKIAALTGALHPKRSPEAVTPHAPQVESARVEDEPQTATLATRTTRRPPAREPASSTGAGRPTSNAPAKVEADSGLARFRADLKTLNDLELGTAGNGLFSGIESAPDHAVHVVTTAAWDSLPPVGQQSYLDSLLDYWVAAQGGSGPAVVRVVDQHGRVLLEKSMR